MGKCPHLDDWRCPHWAKRDAPMSEKTNQKPKKLKAKGTPLTVKACEAAKPMVKPYKLGDGGGMYLEIMPNGSKYWRLKYRWLGKEKRLALGVYPTIGLADARERREEARKLLAKGIDPSAAKRQEKRQSIIDENNTFQSVALE